jgi:phenylacetate-CoA ligase
MDVIKYIIKYINYPLAMRLTGQYGRVKVYRRFVRNQYRPYAENINERDKRLYKIVMYAIKNVPFYHDFAKKNKLSFTVETITEDIKSLPIMTKEIIRKEGKRLYSKEKVKFHTETSGGSTGEPVQLRHDDNLSGLISGEYFLSYAGYDIGDKVAVLWGSERDILAGSIGLKAKVVNRLVKRRRFLNSFMMDDETMRTYVKIINKWKPKVILAYVQSIFELAKFIEKEGLEVYSPGGGIVVSAGTLFQDWKQLIEKVFRCPVINQYGSRETPAIAISCKQNDELHVNTFINYVEIVDEMDQPLLDGEDGEIIVTNLYNKSMPLIRYRIGDIGALSSKKQCKCKRSLPKLKYVKGRTVNIFKRRDGAKIDGEYFTHLFYGIDSVKKFQVIQEDYEHIKIKMELDRKLKKEAVQKMTDSIKAVMGKSCEVEYEFVDKLAPTSSGKYLYTISKVD